MPARVKRELTFETSGLCVTVRCQGKVSSFIECFTEFYEDLHIFTEISYYFRDKVKFTCGKYQFKNISMTQINVTLAL